MVIQKSATGRFSSYLALLSFGIGTFLLVMHLLFPQQEMLLLIGFFYVLLAFILNFIALLNLIYQFITNPFEREMIAIRIMILLSNIPIAVLYFYIIINKS